MTTKMLSCCLQYYLSKPSMLPLLIKSLTLSHLTHSFLLHSMHWTTGNCSLLLWFFFSFVISFLFCSTLLIAIGEDSILLTIVISLPLVQLLFSSHTYSLIYLLSFIGLTSLLPILSHWSAVTVLLIMVCFLCFHHILSHSTSYSIRLSFLGLCVLVLHI